MKIAVMATLVFLVSLLTGCSFQSGPTAAGTCDIVGLRDISADDARCVEPEEMQLRQTFEVGANVVTVWNDDDKLRNEVLPVLNEDYEIRPYPHFKVTVYRMNDKDLVNVQVSDSDRCPVENWTERWSGYEICEIKAPPEKTLMSLTDASMILPHDLFAWLKANAASQGNTIGAFVLDVTTPRTSPLQPSP